MIIDGMNVIGSRPTGWWRDRDQAVRDLLERLQRFAEAAGVPVTLVLDGPPAPDVPEGTVGRVAVRYARRAGRNAADDRIVELLEAQGPDDVVTSDRELRRRAEQLGASVQGAGHLLRRLDAL